MGKKFKPLVGDFTVNLLILISSSKPRFHCQPHPLPILVTLRLRGLENNLSLRGSLGVLH